MHIESSKIISWALLAVLGIAAGYAALRWLLPWLLPFLIAWGWAALMEPAVSRLSGKRLKRGLAAGICLLGTLVLLGLLLWLPLHRGAAELGQLRQRLPTLFAELTAWLTAWEGRLEVWLSGAPEGVRRWAERMLRGAGESLSGLPGEVSGRVLRLVSGLAAAAPDALLFLVTVVLGTYFISAAYPTLLHLAAKALPDALLYRARQLRRIFRRTLGRWLKAGAIMILITFLTLTAAFLLLGVEYPLLLALATALVDALPVFGTGTVLLPWAGYAMLNGETPLAVGLAVTYGAVTLLHQTLQAKLLGDQLGLHPLATLVAIYVGWSVWGVWGMLTFPILATCGKQMLSGKDELKKTIRYGQRQTAV